MRRILFVVVLAGGLAAACGSGDDGGVSQGADTPIVSQATGTSVIETTGEADERVELDVAVNGDDVPDDGDEFALEVQVQVPTDAEATGLWFSPYQFNWQKAGALVVAIPVGWIAPDPNFPMTFVPPDTESFVAQFNVGTSCGGTCGPRSEEEWIARIEEFEFAQFRDADNFTIERESEGTQSRVLVAENSFGNVSMFFARWIEGAPKYFYCRFITSEPESYDLDQFEEACDAAGLFGLN